MTDHNPKPMIAAPTALGLALLDAANRAGLDVSHVRLPMKRKPAWTVTRRDPKDKKRGRKRG